MHLTSYNCWVDSWVPCFCNHMYFRLGWWNIPNTQSWRHGLWLLCKMWNGAIMSWHPHITYFLFHTHNVLEYPLSHNYQGCTCHCTTITNPTKSASERWVWSNFLSLYSRFYEVIILGGIYVTGEGKKNANVFLGVKLRLWLKPNSLPPMHHLWFGIDKYIF